MRNINDYIRKPVQKPIQINGKKEQIKLILNEFNFRTMRAIMITLNWEYAKFNEDGNYFTYFTPTQKYLKQRCKELLEEVWDIHEPGEEITTLATGGFKVTCEEYDGIKCLGVEFIPLEAYADYDFAITQYTN